MQPRIPGFAALISLVFLVASDLVVAQITAPNCSDSWKWVCLRLCGQLVMGRRWSSSRITLLIKIRVRSGHISCRTVAEAVSTLSFLLRSMCSQTPLAYNLSPLQQGDPYPPAGPTTCNEVPDPCMCNNVVYNLLSACDGCQGQKWAAYVRLILRAASSPPYPRISWSEYSSTCETLEPDIST